ncbi:hypothetical protein LXA43DRAFT_595749 [Ganoderma leucocontextum]|nr:hypothetical protein LXA43DRAFT_595749 [Ganoderma leucocontextum]
MTNINKLKLPRPLDFRSLSIIRGIRDCRTLRLSASDAFCSLAYGDTLRSPSTSLLGGSHAILYTSLRLVFILGSPRFPPNLLFSYKTSVTLLSSSTLLDCLHQLGLIVVCDDPLRFLTPPFRPSHRGGCSLAREASTSCACHPDQAFSYIIPSTSCILKRMSGLSNWNRAPEVGEASHLCFCSQVPPTKNTKIRSEVRGRAPVKTLIF